MEITLGLSTTESDSPVYTEEPDAFQEVRKLAALPTSNWDTDEPVDFVALKFDLTFKFAKKLFKGNAIWSIKDNFVNYRRLDDVLDPDGSDYGHDYYCGTLW